MNGQVLKTFLSRWPRFLPVEEVEQLIVGGWYSVDGTWPLRTLRITSREIMAALFERRQNVFLVPEDIGCHVMVAGLDVLLLQGQFFTLGGIEFRGGYPIPGGLGIIAEMMLNTEAAPIRPGDILHWDPQPVPIRRSSPRKSKGKRTHRTRRPKRGRITRGRRTRRSRRRT